MRADNSHSGGVGYTKVDSFTRAGNKLATGSLLNQDKQLKLKENSLSNQIILKEIRDNPQDGRKSFSILHRVKMHPEHMCNSHNIAAETQTNPPPTWAKDSHKHLYEDTQRASM